MDFSTMTCAAIAALMRGGTLTQEQVEEALAAFNNKGCDISLLSGGNTPPPPPPGG